MGKDSGNSGKFIFIILVIVTLAIGGVVYNFTTGKKKSPDVVMENKPEREVPEIADVDSSDEELAKTVDDEKNAEDETVTPDEPKVDPAVNKDEKATGNTEKKEVPIEVLLAEEVKLVEKMVEAFEGDPRPLIIAGNAYLRRKKTEKATEYWEKALKIDPNIVVVYENLAELAEEKGLFEEGIKHRKKMLSMYPQRIGLRAQIASNLVKLGRYEDAAGLAEEAVRLDGNSVLGNFLLGEVYYQQKDFEKAKGYYEKTIELSPEHVNAYFGLFNVYRNLKDAAKVKETGAKVKELKAKNLESMEKEYKDVVNDRLAVTRNFIETCLEAEHFYRVRQDVANVQMMLNTVYLFDPNNVRCLERMAALLEAGGRVKDALAVSLKLRDLEPKNPLRYRNLGVIYKNLKQPAEAETAFQKVVELLPESSLGYGELVRLYVTYRNKLPLARELAYIALDMEPSAENHFLLGWSCAANGDRKTAIKQLEKAIELAPDNKRYRQIYEQLKPK